MFFVCSVYPFLLFAEHHRPRASPLQLVLTRNSSAGQTVSDWLAKTTEMGLVGWPMRLVGWPLGLPSRPAVRLRAFHGDGIRTSAALLLLPAADSDRPVVTNTTKHRQKNAISHKLRSHSTLSWSDKTTSSQSSPITFGG